MSNRSGSLAQRKFKVIKQASWLRGSLFYGSKRTSSSHTPIRPVETARLGAKYGSDLSTSATKKKRDDLISKVGMIARSSIIAVDV